MGRRRSKVYSPVPVPEDTDCEHGVQLHHALAGCWNPLIKGVLACIGKEDLCKLKVKSVRNNNRIFPMALIRIDPTNSRNSREVAKAIGHPPCPSSWFLDLS